MAPRTFISAEFAWAAGIIEGEGSVQAAIRSRRGAEGDALIYVRIRVVMSDEDVVARLRDTFKVGRVLPYRNLRGLGSKPLFRWEVSSRADVTLVADAIYPWMGTRRRAQLDRLREMISTHPPISSEERSRRTWAARRANMVSA